MSDIGYMLLEKQKQKQKQGLQNETDSNNISKKEIIAVGTASLIPGSNFQTLTACDPKVVTSANNSRIFGEISLLMDWSYLINGQGRKYHIIKEDDKYNIRRLDLGNKIESTCSDLKCPVPAAYESPDPDNERISEKNMAEALEEIVTKIHNRKPCAVH